MSSMKKMSEELPKIETKMRDLSAQLDWSANESAFIREAAKTVIRVAFSSCDISAKITENRHLLAWTYAIGFYVDPEVSLRKTTTVFF